MKQRKASIALVLALIITLTACGGAGTASSVATTSAAKSHTLVYGSNDYTRINPALDEHGEINALLFDGLTAHDQDNQVVPRLAESWVWAEERNTYTFYLRQDVTWHDGTPFTAADVKFTIEAIQDPANESENASNYEDVEEITVVDDHTITFQLSAPNAAFLDYMTMAILPKHLLEGKDLQTDAYFRHPIGTGPYQMESWDAGQSITLVRNEAYFRGKANIQRIVFRIIPDSSAKALQLKSGELTLSQVTPKDAQLFVDAENQTIYQMKTADYRGVLYNFGNPYWQKNADLIPALNYAIDRQAMVDAVLLGAGEAAYSPLQRNEYNCEDVERYEYAPDKAVQTLEAAGCTKGEDGYYYRGGEKLGFVLSVGAGDQVRLDMAQIAAQQWQAIGVDVTVEVPTQVDWGGQEAYLIGWGSPFDADDHTYKVFGTGKGSNYSSYSNPLVDQYLTQARQTDEEQKRKEAYAQFQKALAEQPAYTFFCYIDAFYVADSRLTGLTPETILGHHGVGVFWNVLDWTLEEANP